MRMRRLAITVGIVTPVGLLAQHHPTGEECPAHISEGNASLVQALQSEGAYEAKHPVGERPAITVPVVFHAVRDSQGRYTHPDASRMDEKILESISTLNTGFAGSGVQFCQAGPTLYIDSDFWALWRPGATLEELHQIDWVEGAVNVYLWPRPNIEGVVAYTFSPIQSIGLKFASFMQTGNSSIFTHYVGHYLDLFHTFETGFGQECASGANCATAGDLVCDTPTDETQGVPFTTCQFFRPPPYPGPCPGDPLYTPDLGNIMSNHAPNCRDHLTQGQKDRAYATLVNIRHELSRTMCSCLVDCDLNGVLDIYDYFCFLEAFIEEEPYACGMSGSGGEMMCDIFDFLAFQDAFVTGCP